MGKGIGGMFRERKELSGTTQGLTAGFSEERRDSQKLEIRKKDIWGCGDCFWPHSICADSGAPVGGSKTGLLKLGTGTQIRAQMKMVVVGGGWGELWWDPCENS